MSSEKMSRTCLFQGLIFDILFKTLEKTNKLVPTTVDVYVI